MSLAGASAANGAAASGPGTGGLPKSLAGESAGESAEAGPRLLLPGLSALGGDSVGGEDDELVGEDAGELEEGDDLGDAVGVVVVGELAVGGVADLDGELAGDDVVVGEGVGVL